MSRDLNKSVTIRKSERVVVKSKFYSQETIRCQTDPDKNGTSGKITRKKSTKMKYCVVCKSKNLYCKRNKSSQSLCGVCAIKASLNERTPKEFAASHDAKGKYLEDAKNFGKSLKEAFEDPEAERLYCPDFKKHPCGCLQKHILIDVNESRKKAKFLLQMLKEAKRLSKLKAYSKEKVSAKNSEARKNNPGIGLGNGQKKSPDFEEFVLQKRSYLRRELKLCERACQKVLCYSNNFLHKKLKTEPLKGQRVEKKGKAAQGLRNPISKLSSESCCPNKCVSLATTHGTLLQQWRERGANSQADSWRVIAEMLTPTAGGSLNCFKFVQKVTGSSLTTIYKVFRRMAVTGGDREPPEHGLKKWWQDQALKFHDGPASHSKETTRTNDEAVTLPGSLLAIKCLGIDNESSKKNVNSTPSSYKSLDLAKTSSLEIPVAKGCLIGSVTEGSDAPQYISDPLWSSDNLNKLIQFS